MDFSGEPLEKSSLTFPPCSPSPVPGGCMCFSSCQCTAFLVLRLLLSVVPLSSKMISAPMARGGMQIRPRFPPAPAVPAAPASSVPLGGQQMPQVFTGSQPLCQPRAELPCLPCLPAASQAAGLITCASNNELAAETQRVGVVFVGPFWF